MGFDKVGFKPIINKIIYFSNYIYCISLLLLIIHRERIIFYIYVMLISIRILYNVDWSLFVEHYILDGSILLMEGENPGEHKPSEIPKEDNKQPDNNSSNEPIVYFRDNGGQTTSKNLQDWGFNKKHDWHSVHAGYRTHCQQMANLLEYHSKVLNHTHVNTFYDDNFFLGFKATEFFEHFCEKNDIPKDPSCDKVANTLEFRNRLRAQTATGGKVGVQEF